MKSRSEDTAMVKKILRPVLVGACMGAVVCLLLLLMMAAVIAAVDVPKAAITPLAIVASAVGAFIGGVIAAKIAKEKGMLFGARLRTDFVRAGIGGGVCRAQRDTRLFCDC